MRDTEAAAAARARRARTALVRALAAEGGAQRGDAALRRSAAAGARGVGAPRAQEKRHFVLARFGAKLRRANVCRALATWVEYGARRRCRGLLARIFGGRGGLLLAAGWRTWRAAGARATPPRATRAPAAAARPAARARRWRALRSSSAAPWPAAAARAPRARCAGARTRPCARPPKRTRAPRDRRRVRADSHATLLTVRRERSALRADAAARGALLGAALARSRPGVGAAAGGRGPSGPRRCATPSGAARRASSARASSRARRATAARGAHARVATVGALARPRRAAPHATGAALERALAAEGGAQRGDAALRRPAAARARGVGAARARSERQRLVLAASAPSCGARRLPRSRRGRGRRRRRRYYRGLLARIFGGRDRAAARRRLAVVAAADAARDAAARRAPTALARAPAKLLAKAREPRRSRRGSRPSRCGGGSARRWNA